MDQLAQKEVEVQDVRVGSLHLLKLLLFPSSSLLEGLHSLPVMTCFCEEMPVRIRNDPGVMGFAFVCRKCS